MVRRKLHSRMIRRCREGSTVQIFIGKREGHPDRCVIKIVGKNHRTVHSIPSLAELKDIHDTIGNMIEILANGDK